MINKILFKKGKKRLRVVKREKHKFAILHIGENTIQDTNMIN